MIEGLKVSAIGDKLDKEDGRAAKHISHLTKRSPAKKKKIKILPSLIPSIPAPVAVLAGQLTKKKKVLSLAGAGVIGAGTLGAGTLGAGALGAGALGAGALGAGALGAGALGAGALGAGTLGAGTLGATLGAATLGAGQ